MASDTSAGLRITIWRPYTPERPLTIRKGETDTVTLVSPDMLLQQEAFTWQVREDVWGGLPDNDLREALSHALIGRFEPVLPPAQRGMTQLQEFIAELEAAQAKSEWATSGQQLHADGETPVRFNPLLGFLGQLKWLFDLFRDVPGASVSVR
jgi:hypothetical protein